MTATSTRRLSRAPLADSLLEIADLTVEVVVDGSRVPVVRGVSLAVAQGETLAVLGESGSGKTLTGLAVMGLLPANAKIRSGSISYRGTDLIGLSEQRRRELRGAEIAMVFQDPLSSLNPVRTVGYQVGEAIWRRQGKTRREATRRAVELLDRVGIPAPDRRVHQYPHEFSGGMRQRVAIAIALSQDPHLIICDEPTTALDVTMQAQILSLLRDLQADLGMGIVFITHDIGVAASMADRVCLMYAGKVVESASMESIATGGSQHPYTRALLDTVPSLARTRRRIEPIRGTPPIPGHLPGGCAFHPRCSIAVPECGAAEPDLVAIDEEHFSACPVWQVSAHE